MEQPSPQDFGVTPEEYALYSHGKIDEHSEKLIYLGVFGIAASIVFPTTFVVFREWWEDARWWILVPLLFIGLPIAVCLGASMAGLIISLAKRAKRSRLLKTPVASQIRLYEEAYGYYLRHWQQANQARQAAERAALEAEWAKQEVARVQRQKVHEHWMSMSGLEFEHELGSLYRRLGYNVQMTATSGDHGIDLILRKDGKTMVVQCKSHQAPVGESVARDLLGSMHAVRADSAILACTGGFTRSARKFVESQPIRLITVQDIIALADSIELGEVAEPADNAPSIVAPVCPMPGCGKVMALRKGRYGLFWGCPDYPKCRGTRDAAVR